MSKWNGISWTEVGSSIDGVGSLAVIGTDLYATGKIITAGGGTANNIARWDGTSWTPLGDGTDDYIWAMTVHGTDLYVAGRFTNAGGLPANHIAKWDGATWTPLGSGTDGEVRALATLGDELYVGGEFNFAGGKVSPILARVFLHGVPSLEFNEQRATAFFRDLLPGPYRMDRSLDLKTWEPLTTRFAGETGGIDFTDEQAPASRAFYRAVATQP